MRKTLMTVLFAIIAITYCNAQKIEEEKVFGGTKYTQNGERLNMNKLVEILSSNQQSYDLIKKAKSNIIIATILGSTGGALIGYPIGTALADGDPNWNLALIGAGIVAISIPFSVKANKQTKKAVWIHNDELSSTSNYKFNPEFKFSLIGNRVGITMNF